MVPVSCRSCKPGRALACGISDALRGCCGPVDSFRGNSITVSSSFLWGSWHCISPTSWMRQAMPRSGNLLQASASLTVRSAVTSHGLLCQRGGTTPRVGAPGAGAMVCLGCHILCCALWGAGRVRATALQTTYVLLKVGLMVLPFPEEQVALSNVELSRREKGLAAVSYPSRASCGRLSCMAMSLPQQPALPHAAVVGIATGKRRAPFSELTMH